MVDSSGPARATGPTRGAVVADKPRGDALAVARGYVRTRLTYRHGNPAGLSTAATAPGYSTRALAARTQLAPAALDRLRAAQETSRVSRLAARPADEAPHTASTRYVDVAFAHTVTYRGSGPATSRPAAWTLRLVADRRGRWLVDAVLSTG